MSYLTEVTLVIDDPFGGIVDQLTTTEFGPDQYLNRLDPDMAGGRKWYVSNVWAAMFNYVAAPQVIDVLNGLDWGPARGILIIDCESYDGDTTVHKIPLIYRFPGGAQLIDPHTEPNPERP